jgi:hypothetical protein
VLVRVVGVDLSAEPVRTAAAVLRWDNGKAVVEDLRVGADDEALLAALATADKAGIEWHCPGPRCRRHCGVRE